MHLLCCHPSSQCPSSCAAFWRRLGLYEQHENITLTLWENKRDSQTLSSMKSERSTCYEILHATLEMMNQFPAKFLVKRDAVMWSVWDWWSTWKQHAYPLEDKCNNPTSSSTKSRDGQTPSSEHLYEDLQTTMEMMSRFQVKLLVKGDAAMWLVSDCVINMETTCLPSEGWAWRDHHQSSRNIFTKICMPAWRSVFVVRNEGIYRTILVKRDVVSIRPCNNRAIDMEMMCLPFVPFGGWAWQPNIVIHQLEHLSNDLHVMCLPFKRWA